VERTEAQLELRLEGLLLGLSDKNILIFIDTLDEKRSDLKSDSGRSVSIGLSSPI
jgi:hypothetical protein